jgi:hypothetical protein
MNELTDSPYKTPESHLAQSISNKNVQNLGRFTAWGVFGLTVITLGIYPIYWMYSRAKIINSIHEEKISSAVLILFVVVEILWYSSVFFSVSGAVIQVGGVIAVVNSVLYLIVLFTIRNRLRDIVNRSGTKQYKVGIVLTFFFSVIYLQYKINKCIDELQPDT